MARRLVTSRFTLTALVLLPCSLLLLQHWGPVGGPPPDEELPTIPTVRLTRESKPTIVKPSENWLEDSSSPDALAPNSNVLEVDADPSEVPFLPPPLQTADERGTDRR